MEKTIHVWFRQILRARLEMCRLVAVQLMEELDHPSSTEIEKRALFRRWELVIRDGDNLEFMLELLRHHESEAAIPREVF
jgi:hypothetical protein